MNHISTIIQENIPFSTDGNIVHFILNDEERRGGQSNWKDILPKITIR